MRGPAFKGYAICVALAFMASACGRIGYDPNSLEPGDGDSGPTVGPEADATVGPKADAGPPIPDGEPGLTTFVTGQIFPRALAVDAVYVYWSADSQLWRMPKTGGAPESIVSVASTPYSIAVDATHIYWADYSGQKVARAPKSGGVTQEIATNLNTYPQEVVLDQSHVYWPSDGGTSAVQRVGLAGGSVDNLIEAGLPDDVALDDTYLYWVSGNGNSDINRVHKQTLAESSLAMPGLNYRDLASDATSLYVASSTELYSMPKAGGPLTPLAASQPNLGNIAVGPGYVAWTNFVSETGNVMRVSTDGGPLQSVAPAQNSPSSLLADGNTLYWIVDDRIMRNIFPPP